MSRTTATVLFTDLVGSTELRGRLGEEAADELRRRHDQVLAQAVEANNGRVVKGLEDGIMATFGGAADAVAAAVAIQQAVDRLNRSGKAPVPLAVRVGLSAGDVSFEDDDVHGGPVVESSRLCGAAVGGEILASEVVRWLGGAQGALSLTPVGSLELKGLADAVPTARVEWDPAPASALPMPALLSDIGRNFVGRDAQLERLGQLWKEAVAGERRVALLAGEPGVGKTRLAAELAIRVHDDGGVVLAGRCDEDLGVPYQPFVEAGRHFVDHTQPGELKERLGRYGGELTRLIPELAERAPGLAPPLQSDPETERYRLFDAVAAWLSAASAEEPVLLVLDDLQWAAKPTLLLLRHVVRASDPRRLLIVATYRDSELAPDHPLVELLADLRRDGAVDRLPLSGLDDVAVAALVQRAAGQTLDEEGLALASAIHEETEGNPFFVRELLRHLAETNAIERDGGRWTTRVPIHQLGIPEGVREVVGRRLARLSEGANQALRVAAVVGPEFEADVVRVAAEMTENQLLGALDEAVGARLVSEVSPARFRFAHAVVRATLYDSLSGTRTVSLHRAVGLALEATHEGALEDYLPALAHHWARASALAADTTRAVDYAVRAGDRAIAQLAHDEAAAYYLQALELLERAGRPGDDAQRVELLIALGEAQRQVGDAAYRQTLLDAAHLAQQVGDPDALARAALANYRGFFSLSGSVDAERVAVLEAALDATGLAEAPLRARLLANLAVELHFVGDSSRRRALSDEALTIARRFGDPLTLAHVLNARCVGICEPSTTRERLANSAELLSVAERFADPAITIWAWVWRFWVATEVADLAESDRSLDHVMQLAADLRQPMLMWVASYMRAGRLLLAGQLREAEQAVTQTRELGVRAGQPDVHMVFGLARYQLRFEQGRLDELADRLWQALDEGDQPLRRAYVALAYCELDRIEDARRVFAPLAARVSELPINILWLELTSTSAAVCHSLGDRPLAARLLDLLRPFSNQLVGQAVLWWGSVSHYLGLLAATLERYDEAEAHFSAAQSMHEQFGAPTWLARTHLEWARMLLNRGQPGGTERARVLLGHALGSARELGLGKVERDTAALLQDCS
jgi:class 3 adenylate cyclase/tetratricopeptide (TPR) repeat protein